MNTYTGDTSIVSLQKNMTMDFEKRLYLLEEEYSELVNKQNEISSIGNGVFDRYKNPVLTAGHAPLFWRYDLDPETNPYLAERFGINAVFNAGAIKLNGKYLMVARVEGAHTPASVRPAVSRA